MTLMKKIKTVITEKHHFDNRDESNKFLEILRYQDFDARIKINSFSVKSSSTGVQLSYKTLLEEIKPVITEKYEVECRQKSTK